MQRSCPFIRLDRSETSPRMRTASRSFLPTGFALALAFATWLLTPSAARAAQVLQPREWTVEGVARSGLIHAPAAAKDSPSPVVFVFHGHGGAAQNAARQFGIERHWPEAIVVYLQGLNTPGRLTDPEGKKPGWQHGPGAQGDRDLKFFDAVLAGLRTEFQVDAKRIYATGHSNGGGFTYLLWRTRGDLLAALAPSAAAAPARSGGKGVIAGIKPKPVLHVAGEKDALVKFEWQQAAMEKLRAINGCAPEGKAWAPGSTIYTSPAGPPVVTVIHPGAHNFPAEAPALIVRFFKEHALP